MNHGFKCESPSLPFKNSKPWRKLPGPGRGDREIHTYNRLTTSYQRFHQFPTLCLPCMTLPDCLGLFCKCWHCAMCKVFSFFFGSLHGPGNSCYFLLAYRYPAANEYLQDHQTPVLFIWHLSSCFISVNVFFSPSLLLQHKGKSLRVTGYCLPTSIISFFSSFFFKQEQNSFGAWEKLLNQETLFMFVFKQCFCCLVEIYLTTVFWVKLSSSGNTFAFLHYAWY